MLEGAGGSDWELSKENIQPLSSGRKMSILTHSLDRMDETELNRITEEMERQIREYEGPDPLEPWMKYIEFLEQSCPTGGKPNGKYDYTLQRCFQFFSTQPEYKEDKRIVEIYLKAVQNFPANKRAMLIEGILNRGFGVTISRTYLAIADALESAQNFQEAVKTLRKGIEAGAQPVEYLEDALKNLQFRVAQKIALNFQNEDEEALRNFGSSVPTCKLTNEAQNIRVALSPGNPCRARPVSGKKSDPKIAVFQGFQEADDENETPQAAALVLPSQENEMKQSEQENIIKPKKWCNEFLPPPPVFVAETEPPIDIYVDEPEIQPRREELSRKIDRGILSERKIEPEETPSIDDFVKQKIPYRKNQLDLGRDREISFEHLRAKEYLRRVGVTTLRALVGAERKVGAKSNGKILASREGSASVVPTASLSSPSKARDPPKVITAAVEPQRFQRVREELEKAISELKENNEVKIQIIQEQRATISELENRLLVDKQKANSELAVARNELQNYIKNQEKLLEENQELKKYLAIERSLVERLKQEKDDLRHQFEEEKHRLLQEFERERNESLLSFKIDHRSIVQEEEKIVVTAEVTKTHASPVAFKPQNVIISNPIPLSQRLGFTLYESNLDGVEDDVQPVNLSIHKSLTGKHTYESSGNLVRPSAQNASSNIQHDFAMPLPPPKHQVKQLEEDKENMSAEGNRLFKPTRPLTGVLLPSSSAEPMELIYNDEEEDEVMMKNPEGTVDFNVTDLTRALQLYPRPLVNSTPEKINTDETCDLPHGMMINNKCRPFPAAGMDAPLFDAELPKPVIQDALRLNMEPLNYEDENNLGDQKESSFNSKPDGVSYPPEYMHHLSPIPEASKERWSSCTSSSSSNNMTNTRGTNFSVGSSYNMPKSVPRVRLVGRPGMGMQRSADAFLPPRSHTFDNNSQN